MRIAIYINKVGIKKMEIKYFDGYSISSLRAWIVIGNYLIGVFGGYKKLGIYLTSQVQNSKAIVVSPLIQFTLYCFIIGITVWGMFLLIKDGFYKFEKIYFRDVYSTLIVGCFLIAVILIFVSLLDIKISLNMMNRQGEKNILLTIFTALIYAPIVEELVFRGALMNVIKFENKYISLLIIAVIFSIGHVKAYGFSFSSLFYFLVYVILGFSFGVSYIDTKSILGAILSHFYWNLMTVFVIIIKLIIPRIIEIYQFII